MEKQKKLSLEGILSDRDMMLMAVLLIILISESADLPLILAVGFVMLF
ncbi:MAG: hypothetical protein FWH20_10050 [Oscillospiraceae bacterium]|nr:hypothetical protein [Oscillospiraceae bacterium]